GGQPGYGAAPGYPAAYGPGGHTPDRPGAVTTAAVLGFIVGALATVAAIFLFSGGSSLGSVDEGGSGIGNALAGLFIFIALLVVAIAVIMIWGSVLALTGRSRVLLIVGASLLTGFGILGLLGAIEDSATTGGGIVAQLIFLMIMIVIIVLLSLGPASQYFAAHRARRGR
ncbi:MAG: hypothetical protein M3313_09785, partial [Actinomycetota bacterium]|nr:hypothetical protein [Actinomycetota bacterium]